MKPGKQCGYHRLTGERAIVINLADIAGNGRVSNSVPTEGHGETARYAFPRLTWTALDVGGPCVGTFGMNIDQGAPAFVARPRISRSLLPGALFHAPAAGFSPTQKLAFPSLLVAYIFCLVA